MEWGLEMKAAQREYSNLFLKRKATHLQGLSPTLCHIPHAQKSIWHAASE